MAACLSVVMDIATTSCSFNTIALSSHNSDLPLLMPTFNNFFLVLAFAILVAGMLEAHGKLRDPSLMLLRLKYFLTEFHCYFFLMGAPRMLRLGWRSVRQREENELVPMDAS
jgi:hypothetical protein